MCSGSHEKKFCNQKYPSCKISFKGNPAKSGTIRKDLNLRANCRDLAFIKENRKKNAEFTACSFQIFGNNISEEAKNQLTALKLPSLHRGINA
jgi:hypothetical protein